MPPMKLKLMGGGVDISLPNVSYCEDVKDVHFNPYNTVEFYVGEVTEPQTVKIYTDLNTSVPIQVSEGNKWYSYLLSKDKGLFMIVGNSVKKVVVKADISHGGNYSNPYRKIIPFSTVEASFKGSDTSKVTNMDSMFNNCSGLKSLDLSGWNTSNVTNMIGMFYGCSGLTSLDLRNFNTSNVTAMTSMFSGCTSLASLDLRNFNTSKVTRMSSMFEGCTRLTSLDLSGWDMSNVTRMVSVFEGCSNLTEIKMVGCSQDTIQKITDVKPSGATIVTK